VAKARELDCERNRAVVWPTDLDLKWNSGVTSPRELGYGFDEIIGLRFGRENWTKNGTGLWLGGVNWTENGTGLWQG
jgi:hypothetical protein